MKKSMLHFIVLTALTAAIGLSGCGKNPQDPAGSETTAAVTEPPLVSTSEDGGTNPAAPDSQAQTENTGSDPTAIRIGSLKGPTSMGLLSLMENAEKDNTAGKYKFTMVTAADELLGQMAAGNLDIALVPANVASVLSNRTQDGVKVLNINTLGVLYLVSADTSIQSIADLKGRTILLIGKGSTPDYVMNYLLTANGLSSADVTLEYKSEPTEVAALLAARPDAVAMLPQPFVTAATMQNESLKIVLDCTSAWDALQGDSGSRLVTGVTIVRSEFLSEHPQLVEKFMKDHLASADYALANPEETAELIVKAGIIQNIPAARQALPYCNIVCISGDEMKSALSGYLEVLFSQDPASVGGALPGESFYYLP